tara:strand:- start:662 stop:1120 length:459 start_codon:yes stop_codon:yes gene_type:complete
MKNISSSLFGLFAFFAVLIIFGFQISCSNDTKPDKPKTAEKTKEFKSNSNLKITLKDNYDVSTLKSVCDCYKESLDVLEKISIERQQYSSKEIYEQNKESVKTVNTLIKSWKTVRTYCLMTYKRAMFMENDCYPIDIIEKKRDDLYKLGLDT